jgi:tetratricopeptide (TPR) repeat protein
LGVEGRRGAKLEDPGAELLDRMTGFWTRWGRIALGVLGGAVVIFAVVFFSVRARAAQEDQAAGRLAEANLLFWQGDYTRSLQMAKQIIEQYPSTPSGNDAHRLAGDNAFWSGDFKTSITEYNKYLEREQHGLLADATRRSLAYALDSDGQYAKAAPIYDGLVGVFDRESSAEFLMAAARCYRQINEPSEAAKRLRRVIDEFGETSSAIYAREGLAGLQDPPR